MQGRATHVGCHQVEGKAHANRQARASSRQTGRTLAGRLADSRQAGRSGRTGRLTCNWEGAQRAQQRSGAHSAAGRGGQVEVPHHLCKGLEQGTPGRALRLGRSSRLLRVLRLRLRLSLLCLLRMLRRLLLLLPLLLLLLLVRRAIGVACRLPIQRAFPCGGLALLFCSSSCLASRCSRCLLFRLACSSCRFGRGLCLGVNARASCPRSLLLLHLLLHLLRGDAEIRADSCHGLLMHVLSGAQHDAAR